MEWITKIIHKQTYDDYDEALYKATNFIACWCKENDLEYEIKHNADTGCNRVLFIHKKYPSGYSKHYGYRFIISSIYEPTGEYEEVHYYDGPFMKEIMKRKFVAHLER